MPLSPRDVIEDVLSMLQPELERKARIATDFGDAPPVMASEWELSHVFLSVIINAAQAIPGHPSEHRMM